MKKFFIVFFALSVIISSLLILFSCINYYSNIIVYEHENESDFFEGVDALDI